MHRVPWWLVMAGSGLRWLVLWMLGAAAGALVLAILAITILWDVDHEALREKYENAKHAWTRPWVPREHAGAPGVAGTLAALAGCLPQAKLERTE